MYLYWCMCIVWFLWLAVISVSRTCMHFLAINAKASFTSQIFTTCFACSPKHHLIKLQPSILLFSSFCYPRCFPCLLVYYYFFHPQPSQFWLLYSEMSLLERHSLCVYVYVLLDVVLCALRYIGNIFGSIGS